MARLIILCVAERQRQEKILNIERRRLRDASDPLQLPESQFIAHFRLNKAGFHQVLAELRPHLPPIRRKTAVRNELKVLAALNFFANGSYQRSVGASFLNNMSQPTFSRCLHQVINALNVPGILLKHIKFPSTIQERELIMNVFMERFGFPGIVGCIDGTHVALIRPQEHEESYYNRKNYHSLNVLIICDANLNILHVDASFGGASHDSFVWNQCWVKSTLETLHRNRECCWLLGDSGYAQRPWMMTPIIGAAVGSPDEFYTNLHCQVRNTVERCIRVLKARWRCLLAHRVLHYDPVTVGKIVNACVVLHNIANGQNLPMPDLDSVPGEPQDNMDRGESSIQAAGSNRNLLVQRLWNARHIS